MISIIVPIFNAGHYLKACVESLLMQTYADIEIALVDDSSTDGSAVSMRYGILLDMVGGEGARFYQEQVSLMFAPSVVSRVWAAAHAAGYGSFFVKEEGGGITDDHVPVNRVAGIPCIDIIAYYPDCEASSFGPTWHTVNDTMEHIDRSTLEAVGQTLLHVLYAER